MVTRPESLVWKRSLVHWCIMLELLGGPEDPFGQSQARDIQAMYPHLKCWSLMLSTSKGHLALSRISTVPSKHEEPSTLLDGYFPALIGGGDGVDIYLISRPL